MSPIGRIRWMRSEIRIGFVCAVLSLLTAGFSPGQSMSEKVDAYLGPLVRDDLISGTVLIARDGEILTARGYGPANREYGESNTAETKFRLGSLSKQFTAAAVLLLQQDGRLSVQDPLSRYYPDFPRAGEITLHHLLTHTSGIPNFNRLPDYGERLVQPMATEEVIAWFRPDSLEFDPGSRFAYSNSGYVLLAGIIQKVSGQSFEDFLRIRLFEPLGMNDTGQDSYEKVLLRRADGFVSFGETVEHAPYRNMPFMAGAGSIFSTAMDLYKWDLELYNGAILSEESREKMFTAHAENYGYGWFIEERAGRRVISHRGEISGFIVSLDRYVDDRVLVVSLFNYESVFARRAIRGLCEIAVGSEPPEFLVSEAPEIDPVVLDAYAGDYLLGQADTLSFRREGESLLVRSLESGDLLPAVPQNETLFWIPGLKSMVRFDQQPDGRVGRLILLNSVHAIPVEKITGGVED